MPDERPSDQHSHAAGSWRNSAGELYDPQTPISSIEEYLRLEKLYKETGKVFLPAVVKDSPAAYHVISQWERQLQAAPKSSSPESQEAQPKNIAELLQWCERQTHLITERVRLGGPSAVHHDPVIHRIGRDADFLARAFCPPAIVLSLPVVPITAPHMYDHHKALTVLHFVAEWCRTELAGATRVRRAVPTAQNTEQPLTIQELISAIHDVALDQLDVWSFFSSALNAQDARDLKSRSVLDCAIDLARSCSLWEAPNLADALECYALVSRQPYATFYARGRSSAEFVLQNSFTLIRSLGSSMALTLIRPAPLTEHERQAFAAALALFGQTANRSSIILDPLRCEQLRADIEWEAVHALTRVAANGASSNPSSPAALAPASQRSAASTQSPPTDPLEVFFSYSHQDERFRDELGKHLIMLKRDGIISAWHDRKIGAGTEWEGQIDEHLNTARVVLVLVSVDFLNSRYCYDKELKRALARHDAREARVIPGDPQRV
jgi:hypothetical protein